MLLAGPSGAGKSTLLRALAGVLLTGDAGELSGEILVGGQAPGTRAGQAALLLQDPADATVAATVGRDVAFGPENLARPRPEIWERVRASLVAVGFPYGEDHLTGRLSGGEGQRLALAGSLALGPELVLLDEPTAMLDPASAEEVRRAVLDVVGGATLVVVEHHLEPWLELVDRLVVLSSSGSGRRRRCRRSASWRSRRKALLAQGVWVPGWPPPAPRPMSAEWAGRGARSPARVPGEPLLEAEALSVTGRLAPVTATFRAGQVVAVRAPSGGGKSTLLAALAGLLPAGSGRVTATAALAGGLGPDPAEWRSPDLAARIGWVSQHPERGFVARTVREEVSAGARDAAAAARGDALLAAFGLRPERRPVPALRRRAAAAGGGRGAGAGAGPAAVRRADARPGPEHLGPGVRCAGRRPGGRCGRGGRDPRRPARAPAGRDDVGPRASAADHPFRAAIGGLQPRGAVRWPRWSSR